MHGNRNSSKFTVVSFSIQLLYEINCDIDFIFTLFYPIAAGTRKFNSTGNIFDISPMNSCFFLLNG